MEDYPKEAVKVGTFVRANRLNKLGVVTDAFYGEKDENETPIIIYTVLLFPDNKMNVLSSEEEGYFLTNEYEYEVTGYLMLKPINLKDLNIHLKGGLFL